MTMRGLAIIGGICLAMTLTAYAGTVLDGIRYRAVSQNGRNLDIAPGALPNVWKLDFWMIPKADGAPIRAYDLDMTKLLHVIIVSDDFKTFIHKHPKMSSTGHFVLDQALPRPGMYHIYADGRPSGIGQQVFRFDFRAGKAATTAPREPRDLIERNAVTQVGGYSVTLSSLSLRPAPQLTSPCVLRRAGSRLRTYIRIWERWRMPSFSMPTILRPFHLHPVTLVSSMEPASTTVYSNDEAIVSPDMLLHVTVSEPGTYKLWF